MGLSRFSTSDFFRTKRLLSKNKVGLSYFIFQKKSLTNQIWEKSRFVRRKSLVENRLYMRCNPVGTSWSNDVETTLSRLHKRLDNVVSTLFDHGVPAGNSL